MIDVLRNLDFEVKSHMSPVNEGMLENVIEYFAGQKAEAKAEDSRKKEVAEKRKVIAEAQKEAVRSEREAEAARRKADKEEKDSEELQVRKKLEEEAARRVAEKLSRAKSETERLKKQAAEAKRKAEELTAAPAAEEAGTAASESPVEAMEEVVPDTAAGMPDEEGVEAPSTSEDAVEEVASEETADGVKAEKEKPPEESLDRVGRLTGASLRERIKQSMDARETEGAGPRIIERRAPQTKERRPTAKPSLQETRPKKKRKKGRRKVDEEEVRSTIKETLADLRSGPGRGKGRRRRRDADLVDEAAEVQEEEEKLTIQVTEFASVSELAQQMEVKPNEIIAVCFSLGLVVTINQRLDMEAIEFIADEFGYEVEAIEEYGADIFEDREEEVDESKLLPRAPIVTVMGHVDHGKTSLLDFIRQTRVVAGEVGGITQHIGAYEVETSGGQITFLDTPGHEAFTAMRARGAQMTDLVVLVVAADDKVMPQTVEAINHARAASVPILVAISKIDLPSADVEGVKTQLSQRNVVVEDYGGDVVCVPVSAKSGEGVDKLLELLIIQADMLELKADPEGLARGAVVEAQLDKGRGPVATVLIEKGVLKEGDAFISGLQSGRVRAILDERGHRITEVLPSQPAQVVGFDGLPQPGDTFYAVTDEKEARDLSQKRQQIRREQDFAVRQATTLTEVRTRIEEGEIRELPLIVKADTDGSVEAVSDSFQKLSTDEVQVRVIHQGVGGVSESDVMLAQASGAIIIGFHVRPDRNAREAAEEAGVEIRLYEIIYEAVEEIKQGLEGLLAPDIKEEVLGTVEVRETFKVTGAGTIAGCMVTEGMISRNSTVRLVRDGVPVYEGRVGSLKRFKDDVREVKEGYECGVGLENFNDVKVGDIIEVFEKTEIARKL
jgi:translation initiation factor IF-2